MTTTPTPNDCCDPTDSLWKDHVSPRVKDCESNPKHCEGVDPSPRHEWVVSVKPSPDYLLMAGECIKGIECSVLWEHNTPNYWDLAWQEVAKKHLSGHLDKIGMAINAKWTHSNPPKPTRHDNQLHIHVSCIDPDVQKTLQKNDSNINPPPTWYKLTITDPKKEDRNYRVLRLENDGDLAKHNLFKLVYDVVKKAGDMQYQTLVVVKRQPAGFYILNSDTSTPALNPGISDGERLLKAC